MSTSALNSSASDGSRGGKSARQLRHEQRRQYNEQRQLYNEEKKRQVQKMGYDINSPPIKSGILKLRTTLRSWPKFYCELRPGMLVYYKEDRHDVWMGTVLLHGGVVIERPTKRDGFTFKFAHPLRQPVHAQRGPNGETWINLYRMPSDHLIIRVNDEATGRAWQAAMRAAMRAEYEANRDFHSSMDGTASLLLDEEEGDDDTMHLSVGDGFSFQDRLNSLSTGSQTHLEHPDEMKARFQQHQTAKCQQTEADESQDVIDGEDLVPPTRTDHDDDGAEFHPPAPPVPIAETTWTREQEVDDLSTAAHADDHVEQLPEDDVASLWTQAAQLAPGDEIALPAALHLPWTQLRESAQLFRHAYFLTDAAKHKNARSRILNVARFILGGVCSLSLCARRPLPAAPLEVHRACFAHPKHGVTPTSRVFYLAEQVNQKTLALAAIARRLGWIVQGHISTSVRFAGRQLVTVNEGQLTVTLLGHSEQYVITLPDIATDGMALGEAVTTLDGPLSISCSKTGWKADIMFGHFYGHTHGLDGSLKLNGEDQLKLSGHWDDSINVQLASDDDDDAGEVLLTSGDIAANTLDKYVVLHQDLWISGQSLDSEGVVEDVARALLSRANNMDALVESRYHHVRSKSDAAPRYFALDGESGWCQRDINMSPWDFKSELYEYQDEGITKSLTLDAALSLIGDTTEPLAIPQHTASSQPSTSSFPRSVSPVAQSSIRRRTRSNPPTGLSKSPGFRTPSQTSHEPFGSDTIHAYNSSDVPDDSLQALAADMDQVKVKLARIHELLYILALGLALLVLMLFIMVLRL